MKAREAMPGLRGFDTDQPIATGSVARACYCAGYRFVGRYIRRVTKRSVDLSKAEVSRLHLAGLAVSPVQHVESNLSWVPSADKGRLYGDGAVAAVMELELPKGITVWCDLEGVASGVLTSAILSYVNYWCDRVSMAGYQPGLYLGWHCRLTSDESYHRTKAVRYWSAYNLNADEIPAVRGVCMKQLVASTPVGTSLSIDSDLVVRDALGGLPVLCAPDEWEL